MPAVNVINIYHRNNYSFEYRNESINKKDPSLPASLERLRSEFKLAGKRRSVEAVILVHEHKLPHVLLLKSSPCLFTLPGGEVNLDEDEFEATNRYLNLYLNPKDSQAPVWQLVDQISRWWRPNFEPHHYPYIPAHITKPKEEKHIYLVLPPEKATYLVPSNMELVTIPLFELYDNSKTYGQIIASLPQALSRFNFNLI